MFFDSHHMVFLLSGLLLAILMTVAWRHRHIPSGQIFLLLLAMALLWNVTFLLELILPDLEMKILMTQFQFIAIGFIPIIWFVFSCVYSGFPLNRLHYLALSIIPAVTLILIWLVPRPNWFWGTPAIISGGSFPVLNYDYGFWYTYVFTPISHLVFLLAIAVLIRAYFKRQAVYRFQILTTIFAMMLPLSVNILYVLGYSPTRGVNYTSAFFGVSSLILAWSLYRYKFLDLLPMAHDIVFSKMQEGILVLDSRERIVDANPAALQILGLGDNHIGMLFPPETNPAALDCIRNIVSNRLQSGTYTTEDDGELRYYECKAVYIRDPEGDLLAAVVSIRDDTEQRILFQRIHEQSIQDDLTGIFNRRFFFQKGALLLRRVIRQQTDHLSLLAIDIDNLKPINDRFGHLAGDRILQAFTENTRKVLRPLDIFCRIGGDEFAVLLPETSGEDARRVAERIIDSAQSTRISLLSDEPISFTVSVGIASTDTWDWNESSTIDELLHIADTRMYQAKKDGGSQASSSSARAAGA